MTEVLRDFTALVVDDEEEILSSYKNILDSFFHTVYTARNGLEALNLCGENPIHAVFVDYEMPQMNGYGFVKALREQHKTVCITLISNHDNPKILQKFFPYKPCGYLFKPLRYQELKKHLEVVAQEVTGGVCTHRLSDRHLVDFERMRIAVDGQSHTLTRLEMEFLRTLFQRRGRVVSFGAILDAITEEGFTLGGIKNLVYRIKRKYDLHSIQNIKGLGYMMTDHPL